MITLICTVRGCGEPLLDTGSTLRCARGHSFDRSRHGYVNLLQPQDRRSRRPGDSREAVAARRRLVDAGYEEPILAAILGALKRIGLERGRSVLDVGCGEGTFLDRVVRRFEVDGAGVDISTAAVEIAARSYKAPTWIVANADRLLPVADASVDVVTSITSRRHGPEMRRVLAPDGRLLVVVPAADDLAELRELLRGRASAKSRVEGVVAALAADFTLEAASAVRSLAHLDDAALADVLASTYRGARASERERVDDRTALDVTLSRDILIFAPVR